MRGSTVVLVLAFAATACTTTSASAPATPATPATPAASTLPAPTAPASTTTPPDTTATTTSPAPTTVGEPSTTVVSISGPQLPQPTGPAAVGVARTSVPGAVAYYPAVGGSGNGHLPYVDQPGWASLAGLDPQLIEQVVPHAVLDATPAPASAGRPVLILLPGWRSLIAFSTSLAEDLASHGYVVVAAQTDIATESTHARTTTEDRTARGGLFRRLLDLVGTTAFAALVGPVEIGRVAIGGHSYAGAIALDVALTDRRVAAVVDIDGGARVALTRPVANRPTLLIAAVDESVEPDHDLAAYAARSPNAVSVGITTALHMDLTDAAAFPSLLGDSVFAPLIGRVGLTGPADTAVIVRRFLDGALGVPPRGPSATSLVAGLAARHDCSVLRVRLSGRQVEHCADGRARPPIHPTQRCAPPGDQHR